MRKYLYKKVRIRLNTDFWRIRKKETAFQRDLRFIGHAGSLGRASGNHAQGNGANYIAESEVFHDDLE